MTKKISYKKTFSDKIIFSNRCFQKILNFYLFECPVPGKSYRGRYFSYYGISGSPAFGKLKRHMLDSATPSLKDNFHPCMKTELESCFETILKVHPPDEYCVFLKNDENTVMQSLFSAIRNSFAHGSFSIKSYNKVRIYFFSNYDKYLKAEIVLQEDTLLKWIDCIKNFSQASK